MHLLEQHPLFTVMSLHTRKPRIETFTIICTCSSGRNFQQHVIEMGTMLSLYIVLGEPGSLFQCMENSLALAVPTIAHLPMNPFNELRPLGQNGYEKLGGKLVVYLYCLEHDLKDAIFLVVAMQDAVLGVYQVSERLTIYPYLFYHICPGAGLYSSRYVQTHFWSHELA